MSAVQASNSVWQKSVHYFSRRCSRNYQVTDAPPLGAIEWTSLRETMKSAELLPSYYPLACNETHRLTLPADELRQDIKRASIAFAFMLRDVEPYLMRNLAAIMALGERFRRYWMFFVENDSRDRTQEIMRSKMRELPGILHGTFLGNISRAYSVALCPESFRNCAQRIKLLASLRQHVFDLAWQVHGWTALVMLDFDFAGFSEEEFMQMFALGMRMNAAAIVGVSMTTDSRKHCAQYDRSLIGEDGKNLLFVQAGLGCFGRIMKGHSGFPTLYAKALRMAKPQYVNHPIYEYNLGNGFNDLSPFNQQLYKWGQKAGMPTLVDPRFRPMYSFGEGDLYLKNATLARELMTKPER